MTHDDQMGRRDAVRRALFVLGAAAVAPSALVACGDGQGGDGELSCSDTGGLTPAQLQTRQGQHYVDNSPDPARQCDACRFFTAPSQAGACGGCQVIAGPIHPSGTCDLYAAPT